ncbi:PREDICTED: granulocyte colony-stimulating factor [Aptenodytes forsteri]|uniref:granulocyte colony-stimulating factor n=1 Tax=Aptenodytes forsteri TaxID=9233 RepID=UPI0004F46238|nr:PREDICTED: granulocyte colony-stimulating factor [Aptenodytes forsteri]
MSVRVGDRSWGPDRPRGLELTSRLCWDRPQERRDGVPGALGASPELSQGHAGLDGSSRAGQGALQTDTVCSSPRILFPNKPLCSAAAADKGRSRDYRDQHRMLALLLGTLLWAPWQALHGAPLVELSGDQDFQLFLHKNLEFTRKIKGDVAVLQRVVCDTFQLCKEEELLLVRQDLGIVQVPLEQCHSRNFQAEACFSQIHDGLRAYHGSLAAVLELLPGHTSLVETLQLDAANLSSNIQQQMEDLGLATVTYPTEGPGPLPTFSSSFHHQVGGFFILANFQRFLETAYRALRHLARRPPPRL